MAGIVKTMPAKSDIRNQLAYLEVELGKVRDFIIFLRSDKAAKSKTIKAYMRQNADNLRAGLTIERDLFIKFFNHAGETLAANSLMSRQYSPFEALAEYFGTYWPDSSKSPKQNADDLAAEFNSCWARNSQMLGYFNRALMKITNNKVAFAGMKID